jgi:hypothetical protein
MSHKLCNFILAENKKAKKDGKGKSKKVSWRIVSVITPPCIIGKRQSTKAQAGETLSLLCFQVKIP